MLCHQSCRHSNFSWISRRHLGQSTALCRVFSHRNTLLRSSNPWLRHAGPPRVNFRFWMSLSTIVYHCFGQWIWLDLHRSHQRGNVQYTYISQFLMNHSHLLSQKSDRLSMILFPKSIMDAMNSIKSTYLLQLSAMDLASLPARLLNSPYGSSSKHWWNRVLLWTFFAYKILRDTLDTEPLRVLASFSHLWSCCICSSKLWCFNSLDFVNFLFPIPI